MEEHDKALKAIQKKLVGKELNYKEIFSIMDQISKDRLGDILTTYFVASGYSEGFSKEELYYLTKAMIETGEKLEFKGIVADKHSIGGLPGTRATMILVPIVAAAGFTIPKSSSRAITTPAGTADCMEVLAKVEFSKEKIYQIIEKTNGCIVWGGAFNIAPADDEIIQIEKPLSFESYDKILVSVMAKKIAFGSTHVVIDIPWGKTMKVHSKDEAEFLAKKFEYIAKKFNIDLKVFVNRSFQPSGNGIGPVLEARDALRVLEQSEDRPLELEERSVELAGRLLELCLKDANKSIKDEFKSKYENATQWAKDILVSKRAHAKMMDIIKAQKGDFTVESKDLKPGRYSVVMKAGFNSKVKSINNKNITSIARILGAPTDRKAGIYLNKRRRDTIEKGEETLILYSQNERMLDEAVDSLKLFPIYNFED